MPVNHRVLRLAVAFAFGLMVALWSYQWITNPERAAKRSREEAVVLEAREILRGYFPDTEILHISDPLDRVRAAGKAYIYPTDDGWQVSGHYQRDGEPGWHPFLMTVDENVVLVSLAVEDDHAGIAEWAATDPRLTVSATGRPR